MKKPPVLDLLQLAILGIALSLRLASSDTAILSFLVLAGYALLGRAQVIQALALSWLFAMLSEGMAPLAVDMAIPGPYLVIAVATLSVLLRNALGGLMIFISRPVLYSLALGVFIISHSTMFSPIPDLSILRAVLWTVTLVTLLSAWMSLDCQARERLEYQLFGGLVTLVLVSLPLAFTDIGYLRNGTGFQGVLNHPQAFGLVVAMVGAWVVGRVLLSSRPHWRDIVFLGLCIVLIVMSETRTAGLALGLGAGCTVLISAWIARIPARRLMPGLGSRRLHVIGIIVIIGVVVAGSELSGAFEEFVQKRSDAANFFEAIDLSRGSLVQTMIANFEEEPITGIGFAIASDPSSIYIERDPWLGVPLRGTIGLEKSVLPMAVLEELGIVGFLIVAIWIWLMVRRGAKAGIVAFSVMATLLFTNLGESTLFFPGGMGLLLLILLAWAVTGKPYHAPDRAHG